MATVTAPPRPATTPTSSQRLDEAVAKVRDGAARLARLSLEDRVALARSMQSGYLAIAKESVHAACAAKGLPLGTPLEGEEWTGGPWMVVRHLRLIQQALLRIKHTGNTAIGPVGRTADGRITAQVFPAGSIDGTLFKGVRIDVHLQQGVSEQNLHADRARFYKARPHDGRVVLVLGAGNINAIPSMDVISKIFNEGKACVLKLNPVNAYLGPFLERAYAAAIRNGYLAIVYGGADEGGYLARHASVDEIHITGSDKTYDALLWGPPGAERDRRKRENDRLLSKPVSAELGGVAPVLVVPGPYSDKELAYQAEDVASGLTFNAAFNCNSNRVILLPRGWALRDQFLDYLRKALEKAPSRPAYYPGSRERWEQFATRRGLKIGGTASGTLPWTVLSITEEEAGSEPFYAQEWFAPITAETTVGSADPVEYLDRAVDFANTRLWGTLSAGMVVHPATMKDRTTAAAVERAIARLRYGSVNVNAWSGLLFSFCTPPWGAYPGSTPADIQSGTGWVHNTPMIEGIEKAVMRHPLTMTPKPAYSLSHRSAQQLMPRMTALEEEASWMKVPAVLAAAIRA